MNPAPSDEQSAPRQEDAPALSISQPQDTTDSPVGKPIDLAAIGAHAVEDYFHAPTDMFLVRNPSGRWQPYRPASYKRLLVARGLNAKAGANQPLSEVDSEIVRVQESNDISRYGPLCGRNSGFYEANGSRSLVTEDMRLMEPKEGPCPTIKTILEGLLFNSETKEIGEAQLFTFYGWLKSSIEALRAGRHQQQQALAICGPKDCGKSLVQHRIVTPCLAGRSVDAERYFLGNSDFNSDIFGAEHLTLDDCRASTRIRDRLVFGSKLKGCTSGATVKSCHGKNRDAFTVSPWWRITITLNDDPESLAVLPPLNEDFEDKLILLRASRFEFPDPNTTMMEKQMLEQKIAAEIPALIHWLLNLSIPEKYNDPRRFNIATFHHAELKENLDNLSPESVLLNLAQLTFSDQLRHGPMWITAEDLEQRIRQRHSTHATMIFTSPQACSKYLHRLSTKHPAPVTKTRTARANGWTIHPKRESGGYGG